MQSKRRLDDIAGRRRGTGNDTVTSLLCRQPEFTPLAGSLSPRVLWFNTARSRFGRFTSSGWLPKTARPYNQRRPRWKPEALDAKCPSSVICGTRPGCSTHKEYETKNELRDDMTRQWMASVTHHLQYKSVVSIHIRVCKIIDPWKMMWRFAVASRDFPSRSVLALLSNSSIWGISK